MKNFCIYLLLVVLSSADLLLHACTSNGVIVGSENHITQEVTVPSFHSICLSGSMDLYFMQTSGQQQLELTMPDNLKDCVEVYVKNGTLYFEIKSGVSVRLSHGSHIELRVTAPMVQHVTVNGSGDVYFQKSVKVQRPVQFIVKGSGDIYAQSIHTPELEATVLGSGDIVVKNSRTEKLYGTVKGSGDIEFGNIQTDIFVGSIVGSGDLDLYGECRTACYKLTGSGDISATGLKAKRVSAKGSGSGDIDCYASEAICIQKNGSSCTIKYEGHPTVVNALE